MRKTPRTYPTLLAWRTAHGLNQREAAKVLGISQPVYGRIERGTRFVKGQKAKMIMEATRVPLEVLVGVL